MEMAQDAATPAASECPRLQCCVVITASFFGLLLQSVLSLWGEGTGMSVLPFFDIWVESVKSGVKVLTDQSSLKVLRQCVLFTSSFYVPFQIGCNQSTSMSFFQVSAWKRTMRVTAKPFSATVWNQTSCVVYKWLSYFTYLQSPQSSHQIYL